MKSSLIIGLILIAIAVIVFFLPKHEAHHDIYKIISDSNIELEKPVAKIASTNTASFKEPTATVQSSNNTSPIQATDLDKQEEKCMIAEQSEVLSSNIIASDPYSTGKKERTSPLTLKDEIYMAEYREAKFTTPLPSPERLQKLPIGVRWGLKFSNSLCGRPLVMNDSIAFATYDTQIFKLKSVTGDIVKQSRLWYQPVGESEWHQNKNVIFAQRNGNMTSVDFNSWERNWNSRSAVFTEPQKIDLSIAGVTVYQDDIYVAKFWGSIYVNDARTGNMRSTPGLPYESRITTPIVRWKGKLWFSNVAGEVMSARSTGNDVDWKMTLPSG